MARVRIADLKKRYGAFEALKGVTLDIPSGGFFTLLGPSGCGKTTILRMVAGLVEPSRGRILIGNDDVTALPPNKRGLGLVFQSYALFPHMTVFENVAFGLRRRKVAGAELDKRVREALGMVRLATFGERYPRQLSGGQQQRIAIARALAPHPRVLLFDEPLSNLDAQLRDEMQIELKRLQRNLGITTLFVTHDQGEALSMSDRVVVMHDGRAEQIGTPFEVYNYPLSRFVASFVGTLNVLEAEIRDRALGLIAIEGQEVTLTRPLPAGGDRLQVALRPEAIGIAGSDAGRDDANRLRASIVDVSYFGPLVRVKARVGAATLAFDRFNNIAVPPPPVGSELVLAFGRDDLMPMAET